MRKVIFDTNFLFIPFRFKIDIFSEIEAIVGRFEPIILSTTFEELKKLSASKSEKTRRIALAALEIIKKYEIMNAEKRIDEDHDDVILRVANELKCVVATNDCRLRKRLRKAGIATIFLREKSRLQLDGYA